MSASVSFANVLRMLEECAKGFTWRRTTHGRSVEFSHKIYRDLPKYDEIEVGHIKKMCRHFGILDCAKKFGTV
jgi:hypothetical protein